MITSFPDRLSSNNFQETPNNGPAIAVAASQFPASEIIGARLVVIEDLEYRYKIIIIITEHYQDPEFPEALNNLASS